MAAASGSARVNNDRVAEEISSTFDVTDADSGRGSSTDDLVDEIQGLVELRGILAASLSEVRSATPTAVHDLGHFLDDLARLQALGEIFGDGSDDVHLAVRRASHADHAGTKPVAHRVDHASQGIGVETIQAPRHHGHTVDRARTGDEVVDLGPRQPALERLDLLLQQALLVE